MADTIDPRLGNVPGRAARAVDLGGTMDGTPAQLRYRHRALVAQRASLLERAMSDTVEAMLGAPPVSLLLPAAVVLEAVTANLAQVEAAMRAAGMDA